MDVKTTAQRQINLMQLTMRMSCTFSPFRQVVQVIDASDVEIDVGAAFNDTKATALIGDLGETDFVPLCHVIEYGGAA